MGTGQHRHSGSEETRNFERGISDQFRLNPTNSNLKKYIFRVGQPMSVPARQTKRVNCNTKHGFQKTPATFRPSAFRVRRSMFNVPLSTKEVGKGCQPLPAYSSGVGSRKHRTPNSARRTSKENRTNAPLSCLIVPNRAWACRRTNPEIQTSINPQTLYFD